MTENQLILLEKLDKKNKHGHRYGLYLCKCGTQKEIIIASVNSGRTNSCGCLSKKHMKKLGESKALFDKNTIEKFKDEIIEYVNQGVKNHIICEKLGIKKITLYRYMKKLGIKKYLKGEAPTNGSVIGNWIFLEEIKIKKDNGYYEKYWKCKCACGKIYEVYPFNILKENSSCVDCRTDKVARCHWTGYEEISGSYWAAIQASAKERKKEFNITIEYIWDLFIKQNRKCALSGLDITFPPKKDISKNRSKQTASLDRIDNIKGYIVGNVRWVHKDVNYIRRDLNDEEFLFYIEKIFNYKVKTK